MGGGDVAAVLLVLCIGTSATMAYSMDLAALLKSRHNQIQAEKRKQDGGELVFFPIFTFFLHFCPFANILTERREAELVKFFFSLFSMSVI